MTVKFCLFGYYGQGNAGDEAILASIVSGLTGSDIRLTVYSGQPVLTARLHKVESCVVFPRTPLRLIKSIIKTGRLSTLRAIWRFMRTDVVVIGGGGLFFDTPETNKWLKEYISLIGLAKRLGKKVAIVGVSVGPLHHRDSEAALKWAFEKADLITVRDEQSRETLALCGVENSRIRVIPDLVFALPPCERQRATEILSLETGFVPGNIVVLAPCAYNMGLDGWLDSYRLLVNELVLGLNLSVVFVPMQCIGGKDDRYAVERIVEGVDNAARDRVGCIEGVYSPQEIEGIFSLATFVFSERLHGTIMAANTGRPFISLTYMPKVTGVLTMLGKADSGVSMSVFCERNYPKSLVDIIHRSIHEVNNNSQIHKIQEEARLNLDYLIQLQSC